MTLAGIGIVGCIFLVGSFDPCSYQVEQLSKMAAGVLNFPGFSFSQEPAWMRSVFQALEVVCMSGCVFSYQSQGAHNLCHGIVG